MADSTVLLAAPFDFFKNTDGVANTILDITQAAPDSADKQHIVQFISFSVSAAPAAAVKVLLIEDLATAATQLGSWMIPIVAMQSVNISLKGIKVLKGKSITLRIPALGAAVTASGILGGMTRFNG